jgi:cytochrome c-type protein NapC
MTKSTDKNWLARLLSPSPSRSILSLVAIGIAIGVAGLLGFDTVMHATSTETFCTSCHEMDSPYTQLQKTSHFNNSSGVRATCADCHVPHEFGPKMIRKIEAAREVWGTITGVIDTPEKYAAHAPAMKAREIARLRSNDSQECRNCHDVAHMMTAIQSSKAQQYHQAMASQGKTCIDCHAGIAHPNNTESLPQNTQ